MKFIFSALALLLVTGCTHVFSDRANDLVDKTITFDQLKLDPNRFQGKYIKVGGVIAEARNTADGSEVEVVQFKLDRDDIPDDSGASGGRFLATSKDYLDKMIYKTGRLIAVIGEVTGTKTLPLDEMQYTYPVISIGEIHIWRRSDVRYPPGYYYPFFYDRFYSPYWYYPYSWYGPRYWGQPYRHFRR